jgi:glycylpeptide N-tetradecanoyltransferase
MEKKDVPAVRDLLLKYGKRFKLAPEYSEEEVAHWFVHNPELSPEQVVWTYVVEDQRTSRITDFSSFYVLPSKVIGNPNFDSLKAAYCFFYATEAAFKNDEKFFKERLNTLMLDTLVMAKKVR